LHLRRKMKVWNGPGKRKKRASREGKGAGEWGKRKRKYRCVRLQHREIHMGAENRFGNGGTRVITKKTVLREGRWELTFNLFSIMVT